MINEKNNKYHATAEKSKFNDGWRSVLKNPNGKTSFVSQHSFKKKEDAIEHARKYHDHVYVKGLDSDRMSSPDKSKLVKENISRAKILINTKKQLIEQEKESSHGVQQQPNRPAKADKEKKPKPRSSENLNSFAKPVKYRDI